VPDLNALAETLDRDLSDFLFPVRMSKPADKQLFAKIEQQAADIARGLKGQSLLPRSVLNSIFIAVRVIQGQIPYQKEGQGELAEMANKLDWILFLILAGESPDDRVPGVPRII